jgi:hypothetical protein
MTPQPKAHVLDGFTRELEWQATCRCGWSYKHCYSGHVRQTFREHKAAGELRTATEETP